MDVSPPNSPRTKRNSRRLGLAITKLLVVVDNSLASIDTGGSVRGANLRWAPGFSGLYGTYSSLATGKNDGVRRRGGSPEGRMAGSSTACQPASLGVRGEKKGVRVTGTRLREFAPRGIRARRNRTPFLLSKRQKKRTQRDHCLGAGVWLSHDCGRTTVALLASSALTNESSR